MLLPGLTSTVQQKGSNKLLQKEQFSTCQEATGLNISAKKSLVGISQVPERKSIYLKAEIFNDEGSTVKYKEAVVSKIVCCS